MNLLILTIYYKLYLQLPINFRSTLQFKQVQIGFGDSHRFIKQVLIGFVITLRFWRYSSRLSRYSSLLKVIFGLSVTHR